jgi:hypothetical protein
MGDDKLRSRSTVDLVILTMAFAVGAVVIISALSLFAIELFRPEADTSTGVSALSAVVTGAVNVILGAVAGFIAGRSSVQHTNDGEGDIAGGL